MTVLLAKILETWVGALTGEDLIGRLVWLNPLPRWTLVVAVLPALAALAWWSARKAQASPRQRWTLGLGSGLLRALAVAAVLALIADPARQTELSRSAPSVVVIAIDDSLSMGITDRYAGLPDGRFVNFVAEARDTRRERLTAELSARLGAPLDEKRLQAWMHARDAYRNTREALADLSRRGPQPVAAPQPNAPEAEQRAYHTAVQEAAHRHHEELSTLQGELAAHAKARAEYLAAFSASGSAAQPVSSVGESGARDRRETADADGDAARDAHLARRLDELAAAGPPSRRDLVVELLSLDSGRENAGAKAGFALQALLDEGHELLWFALAGEDPQSPARRIDAARLETQLRASGPQSPLGDALEEALRKTRGRRVAGVVLVTDGREVGARRALAEVWREHQRRGQEPATLFVVGVGDPRPPRELSVQSLSAPKQVRLKDVITATARVRCSDDLDGVEVPISTTLGGQAVKPTRLEVDGKALDGDHLTLKAGAEQLIEFEYPAQHAGDALIGLAVGPAPDEERHDDNAREVSVEVIDKRLRVLYIEGRPRFEWRHLVNALKRDTAIDFQGFLTCAESRWKQPVSLDRGAELLPLERLPTGGEEWQRYDVILLGDADPAALNEQAWEDLDRWVSEQAGGLILIAGQSFSVRRDDRELPATLRALLPVESDARGGPADITREHLLTLTEAGRKHHLFRLGKGREDDRRMFETSRADSREPGLGGWHWFLPVERLKPAAVVLAETRISEQNRTLPLVVEQPYGSGTVLWLAGDETWRWRYLHGDRYYYRFWQNALRTLGAARIGRQEHPFRIAAVPEPALAGRSVTLQVEINGRRERSVVMGADESRTPVLRATGPESHGEPERLALSRADTAREAWAIAWRPARPGTWLFWLDGLEDSRLRPFPLEVEVPSQERSPPTVPWGELARWASPRDESAEAAASPAPRVEPFAEGADRHLYRIDELSGIVLKGREYPLPPSVQIERLSDRAGWLLWILSLLALDWVFRRWMRAP